jgi:cytoskeletal protein CcmA (bactofilin family)
MFKQTKDLKSSGEQAGTIIGEGTHFSGTLRADTTVVVNGTYEGGLQTAEGVIIGKSGVVNGDLLATSVLVEGRVKGNVTARDRVELRTGSRLEGDVHARSFMIEDGVFFQGNCMMGDPMIEDLPEPRKVSELGIVK